MDIPGSDLSYQAASPTGSGDYFTLSVRYKAPDGEKSTLLEYPMGEEIAVETPSEDSAFAAGVAEFGMLLRDSAYAGSATYAGVAEQLESLPGLEDDAYQEEFLYLVKQLARKG